MHEQSASEAQFIYITTNPASGSISSDMKENFNEVFRISQRKKKTTHIEMPPNY